jgi:quinol monooxygenase YgiN
MVIIAGHTLVDPEHRDANVAAFSKLVEQARAVEGCIEFAITADSVDERRANLLEIWESAEALDAWRAKARAPRGVVKPAEMHVRRYDAEDGGPLF